MLVTTKVFENHINKNLSFLKEAKLLIAISGGLDSVFLAHMCHHLKLDIVLAHCNFCLRGEESDADETFVLNLAKQLKVEVFTTHFDTNAYVKTTKQSVQMAARELRYNWFETLSKQLKCHYILTAHHADDNLETFLINLSRGTGLEGLTGIPVINNNTVRPLLPFTREAIKNYAKAHKITWREDSSNASVKYIRNKLRHDVIPVLKEINPTFLQNFNKTQGFLKEANTLIANQVVTVSKTIVKKIDKNTLEIDIKGVKALKEPKPYLYQILKPYNFTSWDDVLNLLDAQAGKQIWSKTHRLIKDRNCLILTKISLDTQNVIPVDIDKASQLFPFGTLAFTKVERIEDKNLSTIYLDQDLLTQPLKLRKWQEGDYFYPIGMSGKKKLSKYFKDQKLSLLDKEHVWLLCSGNTIVWVVNKRADNRFKVTPKTLNILKIEWSTN